LDDIAADDDRGIIVALFCCACFVVPIPIPLIRIFHHIVDDDLMWDDRY